LYKASAAMRGVSGEHLRESLVLSAVMKAFSVIVEKDVTSGGKGEGGISGVEVERS